MKIIIFCDTKSINHDALHAAVSRVVAYGAEDQVHSIHVYDADNDGSQSAPIVFNADEHGNRVCPGDPNHAPSLVVCQLQRHPGAEFEYHS